MSAADPRHPDAGYFAHDQIPWVPQDPTPNPELDPQDLLSLGTLIRTLTTLQAPPASPLATLQTMLMTPVPQPDEDPRPLLAVLSWLRDWGRRLIS